MKRLSVRADGMSASKFFELSLSTQSSHPAFYKDLQILSCVWLADSGKSGKWFITAILVKGIVRCARGGLKIITYWSP
jgi:hypothetical protein